MRGQRNDRDARRHFAAVGGVCPQLDLTDAPGSLEPVHHWHFAIHQDQVK
jgi:hypothetical protein